MVKVYICTLPFQATRCGGRVKIEPQQMGIGGTSLTNLPPQLYPQPLAHCLPPLMHYRQSFGCLLLCGHGIFCHR